jgi:hypothetical protein
VQRAAEPDQRVHDVVRVPAFPVDDHGCLVIPRSPGPPDGWRTGRPGCIEWCRSVDGCIGAVELGRRRPDRGDGERGDNERGLSRDTRTRLLVTTIRRPGAAESKPLTRSATSSRSCSAPSSTSTCAVPTSASAIASFVGTSGRSRTRRAAATAALRNAAPRIGSSATNVTGRPSSMPRIASRARRVLPTPPGPVRHTRRLRVSSSPRAASSAARPTKLGSGQGNDPPPGSPAAEPADPPPGSPAPIAPPLAPNQPHAPPPTPRAGAPPEARSRCGPSPTDLLLRTRLRDGAPAAPGSLPCRAQLAKPPRQVLVGRS